MYSVCVWVDCVGACEFDYLNLVVMCGYFVITVDGCELAESENWLSFGFLLFL